jgi:hypothetical protein
MKDLDENKENFKKVCKEISGRFSTLPYDNGDIGDVGNEIGIIVSKHFSDEIGWDKQSFLGSIDHGIKLNEK